MSKELNDIPSASQEILAAPIPASTILSPIPSDQYAATTDPTMVKHPVETLVHQSMTHAWRVNPEHPMALIFDAVNPVRRFKRGMLFDEDCDFPDYPLGECEDMTYIDTTAPGWMPFSPKTYT